MKLYLDYIKERENAELIYNDYGFASYKASGNGIYIIDVYVAPEFRNKGITKQFIEEIVERTNTKMLFTSSDENANNWEDSDMIIRKCGFKELQKSGSMIYYYKEIL